MNHPYLPNPENFGLTPEELRQIALDAFAATLKATAILSMDLQQQTESVDSDGQIPDSCIVGRSGACNRVSYTRSDIGDGFRLTVHEDVTDAASTFEAFKLKRRATETPYPVVGERQLSFDTDNNGENASEVPLGDENSRVTTEDLRLWTSRIADGIAVPSDKYAAAQRMYSGVSTKASDQREVLAQLNAEVRRLSTDSIPLPAFTTPAPEAAPRTALAVSVLMGVVAVSTIGLANLVVETASVDNSTAPVAGASPNQGSEPQFPINTPSLSTQGDGNPYDDWDAAATAATVANNHDVISKAKMLKEALQQIDDKGILDQAVEAVEAAKRAEELSNLDIDRRNPERIAAVEQSKQMWDDILAQKPR